MLFFNAGDQDDVKIVIKIFSHHDVTTLSSFLLALSLSSCVWHVSHHRKSPHTSATESSPQLTFIELLRLVRRSSFNILFIFHNFDTKLRIFNVRTKSS